MLSVYTDDDWPGAQITIDDGGGPDTFTVTTETSAYDLMEALTAWATTTFTPTFSWSWARDATDGGATLTIAADGSFSMTVDATLQTALGFSASYGSATSHAATSTARGTLDPASQLAVRQAWAVIYNDESAGAGGANAGGIPGSALMPVVVEAILLPLETARAQHIAAVAANPRLGWVHQEHIGGGTWRHITVGMIGLDHLPAANRWHLTIDARGLS